MADIRIKDLATTAASTASDDFVAVDGSANGTRKLNAYSPTFGGNVVATGTLTVNSTTDSSSKDTGAIITEGGLGVEKSASIGGNLTVSGTAGLNGATTSSVLNLKSSAGTPTLATLSNRNATQTWSLSVDAVSVDDKLLCFIESGSTRMALVPTSGNLLLGTTTDSGQKLQVAGTGYFSEQVTSARPFMSTGAITANMTSAGGVGFSGGSANFYSFGANTTTSGGFAFQSVSSNASVNFNALTLAANTGDATFAGSISGTFATFNRSGADGYLSVSRTSGATGTFGAGTSNAYLGTATNHSLVLYTNNVTALTLDSSQRCILAGALRLNNAYVSGAPTATGYVTLQDSAGNTYKVLVGT